MEMTHFTTEEWVDFVNQVSASTPQKAMQRHLESGCKHCMETVSLWQKVRSRAATESSYQPPAESVLVAKASFANAGWAAKPQKDGRLVETLFDSFLQPALVGARSTCTGMRQMLYRADPYQVDIQIEARPDGNRLVITGQLLDVSRPETVAKEIPVKISNRRGAVVHTVTSEFGEFRTEIANSGDLEISFPNHKEEQIVIFLRNALDRLPRGKS
jgi:hypothetical protein